MGRLSFQERNVAVPSPPCSLHPLANVWSPSQCRMHDSKISGQATKESSAYAHRLHRLLESSAPPSPVEILAAPRYDHISFRKRLAAHATFLRKHNSQGLNVEHPRRRIHPFGRPRCIACVVTAGSLLWLVLPGRLPDEHAQNGQAIDHVLESLRSERSRSYRSTCSGGRSLSVFDLPCVSGVVCMPRYCHETLTFHPGAISTTGVTAP